MDNSTGNEGTGAIWLAQIGSTTFPRLSPTTLDLRPEFATPTKLAFLPMQHAVQRAEQITHVASSVLRIARVTHEENQLLLGTGFYVTDTLLMANDCVRQQSKRSDKYFAHSSPVNVFQEPHQFCVETEVLGSELLLFAGTAAPSALQSNPCTLSPGQIQPWVWLLATPLVLPRKRWRQSSNSTRKSTMYSMMGSHWKVSLRPWILLRQPQVYQAKPLFPCGRTTYCTTLLVKSLVALQPPCILHPAVRFVAFAVHRFCYWRIIVVALLLV
eukprot:TRINITY_DN8863_c0_g1_i5.p1 TRINITY_DN8863_c0_g1~~TRINITY_DN8863_c0_g1_i5.p1  ORF type:complete len:271 (-),score=26.30 TRINITY_DN8863_c0_g1_i5:453-1265(-)